MNRAVFDGKVKQGQEYILVDDHITMGGTISELRHYIENNGGKVVAVTSLTASANSTILKITEETKNKLIKIFGREKLEAFLKEFNISGRVEALTESEGRYLAKFKSLDSARAGLVEAVGGRRMATAERAEYERRQEAGIFSRDLGRHLKTPIQNLNIQTTVLQSQNDLPGHLQPEYGRVRGVYDPVSQRIYLVADNIYSNTEAEEVLLHEAVGHHGLRELMGKDFEKFLNRLWLSKAKQIKEEAGSGFNPKNKEERFEQTEEWFARQVEKNKLSTQLFDRFVSLFRDFLRKIGFKLKLSDAEIRNIAAKSRKAAFAGEGYSAEINSNEKPKFSMVDSAIDLNGIWGRIFNIDIST